MAHRRGVGGLAPVFTLSGHRDQGGTDRGVAAERATAAGRYNTVTRACASRGGAKAHNLTSRPERCFLFNVNVCVEGSRAGTTGLSLDTAPKSASIGRGGSEHA